MSAAWRRTVPENSVMVFTSLLLCGLELLEVLGRVLGQLVVVEILVAAVAGELLAVALGDLNHLFHHLLGLVPPPLRAGLRRRRVSLDGDGALAPLPLVSAGQSDRGRREQER